MLALVLDPAHGMAQLAPERGDHQLLGIKDVLDAEAAADIGGDDMHLALFHGQELRHPRPDLMRKLARIVNRQLVEPVIPEGEDGAPFHRHADLAVHAVFALHHDRRRFARRLDVAEIDRFLDEEIVAPFLVEERRAGCHRRQHVGDRRQLVIGDLDPLDEILRLVAGRGDAHRDGLADESDFAAGEAGQHRRLEAGDVRHRADRQDTGEIRGDEDAVADARRNFDRLQPRMRHGAAQEGDLLSAREAEIGDELAAPAQMASIFLAPQARADAEIGCLDRRHAGPPWFLLQDYPTATVN